MRLWTASPSVVIGAIAVALTGTLFAALEWQASRRAMTVGFWFEPNAATLPDDVAAQLGGPLSAEEKARIEQLSRREIERAFAGLQIRLTGDGSGFWRVQVLPALTVGRRRVFPVAGASFGFGPLGGRASLGFNLLAINALNHAPPGARRHDVLDGIGRGVGRAAVHELAHQIATGAAVDNRTDPNSYEYWNADRPAQYYGELHWRTLAPVLLQKIGT